MKKPSVKQKQFVKELLKPGSTQTEAYMQVYAQTDRQIAANNASTLVSKPHVQKHIADALAEIYPDAAEDCTRTLREFIQDPELRPSDRMKAMDLLIKVLGWKTPDRVQKIVANVNLDKYKLPGG